MRLQCIRKGWGVQELIDLAEEFSSSAEPAIQKILEKIEKQRDQKEYTKTEVQDRGDNFEKTLNRMKFDLNQSGDIRILDIADSFTNDHTYSAK